EKQLHARMLEERVLARHQALALAPAERRNPVWVVRVPLVRMVDELKELATSAHRADADTHGGYGHAAIIVHTRVDVGADCARVLSLSRHHLLASASADSTPFGAGGHRGIRDRCDRLARAKRSGFPSSVGAAGDDSDRLLRERAAVPRTVAGH